MKAWQLRLLRYARPEARGLTFLVLAMLVAVALDTLTPWPLKLLVDNALAGAGEIRESFPRLLGGYEILAAQLGHLLAGGTEGQQPRRKGDANSRRSHCSLLLYSCRRHMRPVVGSESIEVGQ